MEKQKVYYFDQNDFDKKGFSKKENDLLFTELINRFAEDFYKTYSVTANHLLANQSTMNLIKSCFINDDLIFGVEQNKKEKNDKKIADKQNEKTVYRVQAIDSINNSRLFLYTDNNINDNTLILKKVTLYDLLFNKNKKGKSNKKSKKETTPITHNTDEIEANIIELNKKIVESIQPEEIIYAEITSLGGMGNTGGIIIYVLDEHNNFIRYEINIYDDKETYDKANILIVSHNKKIGEIELEKESVKNEIFDFYYGGFGNLVFINKKANLEIKKNHFVYTKGNKKYIIKPSVFGVFDRVSKEMKEKNNSND